MKRFYISTIIDCTFTVISVFLITFVIYNCFYYKATSVFLAIFSTIAITLPLLYFLIKKRKAFYQNELLNTNAENLIFSLNFYKQKNLLLLFEKALKNLEYQVINNETHLLIKSENAVLVFKLDFEKVKKVDIVKAYNLLDFSYNQKVYIFAETFEKEVIEFSARFNGKVNLQNKTVIYKLLKTANCINEIEKPPVYYGHKKINFKSFFTKKRAKSYLTSGIIFLAFSFFVYFKVYYIISGCILLIVAIICIFNKTEEQNT